MPSIPALPAAAPSFAERLSVDDRPRTAPSHVAVQQKTMDLAAAAHSQPQSPYTAAHYAASASEHDDVDSPLERPLAPPLPLVLRPPLRKKKSFSRVSSWLFHPDGSSPQTETSSPTMVFTTSPRPVKASDGFYQCVAPPEGLPRTSMETSSSVYTWETGAADDDEDDSDGEEDDEAKTVPTTTAAWSPEQTPKQGSSRHTTPVIGAGSLAGSGFETETMMGAGAGAGAGGLGVVNVVNTNGHRPLSVGVAF